MIRPRPSSPSIERQLEFLRERQVAELLPGTRLDLADALLGDAQLAAELLEGLPLRDPDPVAADQDPALPLVEPAEHPPDDLLTAAVVALLLVGVAAIVGGGLEQLRLAG